MKLCKDCKYWIPNRFSKENGNPRDNFDKCGHPECTVTTDKSEMIRGSNVYKVEPKYCQLAREYSYCGKDAKYFEPRDAMPFEPPNPSLWRKFFEDFGKGIFLIIALVVLTGCESRYTWVTGRQGYQSIGGHLYQADTTHRIDLYHAEHCQCKGGR